MYIYIIIYIHACIALLPGIYKNPHDSIASFPLGSLLSEHTEARAEVPPTPIQSTGTRTHIQTTAEPPACVGSAQ